MYAHETAVSKNKMFTCAMSSLGKVRGLNFSSFLYLVMAGAMIPPIRRKR